MKRGVSTERSPTGSSRRGRGWKRSTALFFLLAAVVAILALSWQYGPLLRPRAEPGDVVFQHRLFHLEQIMETPAPVSMVAFDRALVVIDERLVQNLLLAAVPYHGRVGGFARIVVRSADVSFDDGIALVRFDGSAWLGRGEEGEPLASISIYGALEVVELDPEVSVLRTRLRVIAVDAQHVRLSLLSGLAERLIENLGFLKIESFEGLRYDLEIPLRLGNELRLPEIAAGDVKIAATTILLNVAVEDVRAFNDKLWVSADIAVRGDSSAVRAAVRAPVRPTLPHSELFLATHPRESKSQLRERYVALHADLEARVAADPQLRTAVADSAEIALALRESLVGELLREVARRYLDRIELDIDTEDLAAFAEGELKVKTPLGKIAAGDWRVRLDFQRLRGTLSAQTPDVTVTGKNRVHVAVPVHIESGSGEANLWFAWDPKHMANLLCRGFETSQRIEGKILPRAYLLRGDFVLAAKPEGLVADPEFPPEKFPIAVEPSAETWADLIAVLREQDRWTRCGIAMNPEEVAQKLARLGEKGFNVKLPRSIFRPFLVPASLVKSVRVGHSQVELVILPNVLRVSPGTFWYSASFVTQIERVTPVPISTSRQPQP